MIFHWNKKGLEGASIQIPMIKMKGMEDAQRVSEAFNTDGRK